MALATPVLTATPHFIKTICHVHKLSQEKSSPISDKEWQIYLLHKWNKKLHYDKTITEIQTWNTVETKLK